MEGRLARQSELFTRIGNAVQNLRKLGTAKITRQVIEARLSHLVAYWEKFQGAHSDLIGSVSSEELRLPYFVHDQYGACEEAYLNARAEILKMRDAMRPEPEARAPAAAPQLAETRQRAGQRLPTINLPQFSGLYTEWSHFKDLFTALVHANTNLTCDRETALSEDHGQWGATAPHQVDPYVR